VSVPVLALTVATLLTAAVTVPGAVRRRSP